MALRYKGGFYSYNNVLYDVEIWQEGFTGSASDVAFCASPLEIEWSEVDKIEPVQASHATLQLYSDTDRQFIDLYAIEVGSIRLDVYKNGSFYWSGTLDTELYEEPFSYLDNYGVKLTFSDFAILDRMKFDLTGFLTIRDFIVYALQKSGIKYTTIEEYISTKTYEFDTKSLLDSVSVISDNFYDEDGEPQKLRKVLEGILKPLALHIIQKAGGIFIYDLNSVLTAFEPSEIEWSSDDATLGSDKVYNNVKVTFSTYEKTSIMDAKMDEKDWDEDLVGDTSGILITVDRNDTTQGFRIKFGTDKTDKFTLSNATAKYFLMKPIYSGSEDRGIMYCCIPDSTQYGHTAISCMADGSISTTELFRVNNKPYLCYVSYRRMNYKLKVKLDLLFDVRYNPFEEKGLGNEEGNYAKMQDWCNFAYIPVMITLRDADGNALYHYRNKGCIGSTNYAVTSTWDAGEASWGDAYLCYYDESNRTSSTGLGGWSANKQTIGYHADGLPKSYSKRGEGEFIDLPPVAGWLDVRVGTGIYQLDHDKYEERDILSRCRWMLYRSITIDLVDKYGNEIDLKDQVHKAWINKNAEEAYNVETNIGTMDKAAPTARGVLLNTSTKYIITELYRNGITAGIEKLLIGTIYSNYADRHITLSGTAELLSSFGIYSDKNQAGNYMLLSETQHLQDDESEIKVAAFEADNYTAVKYIEDE